MPSTVGDPIEALARAAGRRVQLSLGPPRPAALDEVGELLAGAAEVDLTPPPGLPKAGYSRNAHTGTGFRTRLRARVVHLRSGTSSVAVVATDLLGGSAVLQHLVAARVRESTDVPLAGIFLGATHTHGAPGQFHGTDFYNRFSSNKPGFDPLWTAFLAERVAGAVTDAVATRRPAALAWGRTEVRGLTRNRSLAAYHRNPGHTDADATSAVNPWLDLLRVDALAADGGTEPLAALAVFSIHGTSVPMTARPYNADLWAYLCDELGDRIAASHGTRPVVGALQGTHGDVTPALREPAGHPEAARIGRGIGEAAADLYDSLDHSTGHSTGDSAEGAAGLDRRPRLGFGFREVDLRTAPVVAGVQLPWRPAVGAALVAGAVENLTPGISAVPPFKAGYGKRIGGRGPHAQKWVIGSRWLQPMVLRLDGFPRVMPVHVVRVGGVLLAGLPMEITTVSGRRIADAAAQAWTAAGGDPVRVVVSSVADEYAGYCTTSDEYALQYYEGGHTLYGPRTQRFFAGCVAEVAAGMARKGHLDEALSLRQFDLTARRFMPTAEGHGVAPRGAGVTVVGAGPGIEPHVAWAWLGPAPGDLRWHERLVQVEAQVEGRSGAGWAPVTLPGGAVLDDGRGELEVTYAGPDTGPGGGPGNGASLGAGGGTAHRYLVRWYHGGRDVAGHRLALGPGVLGADADREVASDPLP
jgi:neutral ceramidase